MHITFSAISRTALLAVCLLAGSPMQAANTLPAIDTGEITPFRAEYSVGNNLITAGSAILSLQQKDDLWLYSLRTRPEGVFKLTGKGRIQESAVIEFAEAAADGNTVRPLRYSYRQDDEKKRQVDARFNWSDKTLRWSRRGETGKESLADTPIFDRITVTLVAMNAMRGEGFEQIDFQVFDNGRVKTVRFINEGKEMVDSPQGKIESIRVRSENIDSGRRQTLTWFAPSLDYVPVKIEQLKRGELVARLILTRLSNRVTEIGSSN